MLCEFQPGMQCNCTCASLLHQIASLDEAINLSREYLTELVDMPPDSGLSMAIAMVHMSIIEHTLAIIEIRKLGAAICPFIQCSVSN